MSQRTPNGLSTRIPEDCDVIVTGLSISGAALLRDLAACGYTVCGMSDSAGDEGFASRHGAKLVCPNPLKDLDGWVAFMRQAAAGCTKRPAILPTGDKWVLALDQAADRLSDMFRFHGFGSGLRSALTSKRHSHALAEQHGLPAPRTEFISSRDRLEPFLAAVGCEVLIKPEFSSDWQTPEASAALDWQKIFVTDNAAELLAIYDRVRPHSEKLIVQEMIPGEDDNLLYWAGFVDADHQVKGRIVGRKDRVLPPRQGSASFVRLLDMPEVEEQCARFLEAVGYQGLCGVELKLDPRDGVAKLIEVNPRFGLWDDLGVPVGVDLPRQAVESLFGREAAACRASRFDYKWVNLARDLRAFRLYRAEGLLGVPAWLATLRPPIVISDFPFAGDFPYAWHNLSILARDLVEVALGRKSQAAKARRKAHDLAEIRGAAHGGPT